MRQPIRQISPPQQIHRGRLSDDLFVAPILQQIALDVLTAPGWPRHLAGVRRALRERRDALVLAVRAQLADCALDVIPAGGVHLWLALPERCSDAEVAAAAANRGVTVTAGGASFPGEAPGPCVRLSYANEDIPELRRGIEILAAVIGSGG